MKQDVPGRSAFLFKMGLALIYTVACAIAENTQADQLAPEVFGAVVATLVLAPLLVCALIYLLWWRQADEYQKAMEYRAMAGAGLGAVAYLITGKLATYFFPGVLHVPSLAVIGMLLVYWIQHSRKLNVAAMQP
jgi:hypothetical protein